MDNHKEISYNQKYPIDFVSTPTICIQFHILDTDTICDYTE